MRIKKLGSNDVCWCNSGNKYKKCHMAFDEKLRNFSRQGVIVPNRNIIKNEEQIAGIKESCKLNVEILDYITDKVVVGVSTAEIDRLIYEKTKELGGIPAPLGYEGFPKSVCVSINDIVCHGIPSENEIIKDGDIVNVDVSTIYKGYFSDSSRMFCVGNVDEESRRLVETVKESIKVGLKEVVPWNCMGNMGQAINDFIISKGYSVVREIGGHGVGVEFHEEPFVSYVSKRDTEMLMVPGMIFTIEPMVNVGKPEVVVSKKDGWTVRTKDGTRSAQWEVMVLVTENSYEVLAY